MVQLEEINSAVNGHLTVVRDLAWGTHIKGGGLTQSGGIAKRVWQTALKKIDHQSLVINHSLILGLGGGCLAKIIKKLWPEATITGVDLDPIIVNLGKKYLGLDSKEVKIVITDAYYFVKKTRGRYELIFIDTYIGDQFPQKFEEQKFLKKISALLTINGIAIFNRLYYGDKRVLAQRFEKNLRKVFSEVKIVYPEANVMFICFK